MKTLATIVLVILGIWAGALEVQTQTPTSFPILIGHK
jgi:uncharacterized membrane protein